MAQIHVMAGAGERLDMPFINTIGIGDLGVALRRGLADFAAPDVGGGNLGLLGEHPRRKLLRRHLQGEKSDDAAGAGLQRAVDLSCRIIGACDIECDVGGEGGFSHAGAAGDHNKIGRLKTTEPGVQVL